MPDHTTEFILRLRVPTWSREEDELEKLLVQTAKARKGSLSKTIREEHATYALHVSRKTLVRRAR